MTSTAINEWEVIIIGAGPAGSAAAMVLARMRRKVLMIDDGNPRNRLSQGMHNYLSRDGILPGDFLRMAHEELGRYHVDHMHTRIVQATRRDDGGFEVTDRDGQGYRCRRLLLATGVTDNIPDIPGMREMWGNGVYHCPFCDGFELCDRTIGLYARRFNGFGMALSLRHLTGKLVLFTDGSGNLRKSQAELLRSQGVTVVTSRIESLYCEEHHLTCVVLRDGTRIPCDAVFTHHGHRVNNELLLQLGARCSRSGAAITNRKQQCSVPGLYVAGDAAYDMHFVAVAAAEGTKAAVAIHDDLMKAELAVLVVRATPDVARS